MAEPRRLVQAQLTISNERGVEALAKVTRHWYEHGTARIGGALWQRLLDRDTCPGDEDFRWGGEAGDVWAECSITYPRIKIRGSSMSDTDG